jgi:hypothetical protein
MPLSDRGSRKLPYPLNKTLEPIGDTPDEPIAFDVIAGFPDETTRVNITLNLSLDEYVALAAAIDVGRDIAFAEDSELIWHIWVRAFSEGTVMSCDEIADCVESELVTNETLINSVTNTINLNGFGDTNRANPTLTKIPDRNIAGALAEPIYGQTECNLDKLWAGIRDGIVQRMDDNARTVLENLAAINDVPERLQTLLDVIPVIGDLAEFFVTNLTQVIPDIENLYAAHSSIEAMDEIACDLFALVCDECRYPSYEEVLNYYKSYGLASGEDIADLTLQMITDFVTGSATTAAEVTYFTIQTWQLFTWYIQATFNGKSGTRTLIEYARLGEDFANDNWLQLCDSCNELYMRYTWDFKASPGGAYQATNVANSNAGMWVSGKGWAGLAVDAGGTMILSLAIPLEPTWQIRAIGMKYSMASGNNNNPTNLRPTRGITAGQSGVTWSWGTTGWTFFANGYPGFTGVREMAWRFSSLSSANTYLEEITIIFDSGFAPEGSIPTNDPILSATVYP